MTTSRKYELKKQVWQLFREKAEARGLRYRNQKTPHQYYYDDVTSAGIFCILQTLRDTPDVWMNAHANVWRKDVAALQKESGSTTTDGSVFSTNLGYLMPDRQMFHNWVFVDRDLHSGELVDLPQVDERHTFGDHRAVVDHLLDAFFQHAVPYLRNFVDLDAVIESRACLANKETWPIVLHLAGRNDDAEAFLVDQLLDFERSGLAYAKQYRRLTETLLAKMGRTAPYPPKVIAPNVIDT